MIRRDDEDTYTDRVVIRTDADTAAGDYVDDELDVDPAGGYMSGEPGADYIQPAADDIDSDVETEVMLDEIAQTRAEMTATIDEIQARLQPSTLADQAK